MFRVDCVKHSKTKNQKGAKTISDFTISLHSLMIAEYDFKLTDYPIFDSTYRTALNNKLLRHYEFYEIGCKSVSQFREFLTRTMDELMPYYNQLYKSALLEFNPFHTFDLETTSSHTITGGSTINNSTTNTRTPLTVNTQETNIRDVDSNTPDGLLSIGNINSNVYASHANIQTNSVVDRLTGTDTTHGVDTATNTSETTDEYISHVVGTDSARTNASILMELRTSFLNIDMMLINDKAIKNLFLGVW